MQITVEAAAAAGATLDVREPLDDFITWLITRGAEGIEKLSVEETQSCGAGVFAGEHAIPPGGLIASVPVSAIMSTARSMESAVGLACAALGAERDGSAPARKRRRRATPRDEFVMWLDMAVGLHDTQHFAHLYLHSLPTALPDAASWCAADAALLDGTNLGVAAREARERLDADAARWLPLLKRANSTLFRSCTVETLRWARAMYFSRRFPTALLGEEVALGPGAATQAAEGGVLLPFFDLLNHGDGVAIEWSPAAAPRRLAPGRASGATDANAGGAPAEAEEEEEKKRARRGVSELACRPPHARRFVSFRAGPLGVAPGAEVLNNYGRKSNEELLMAHGFALPNNVHDTYGLSLSVGPPIGGAAESALGSAGAATGGTAPARRRLGPYYIHRRASPTHEQFPRALWRALAQPQQELARLDAERAHDGVEGGDGSSSNGSALERSGVALSPLAPRVRPNAAAEAPVEIEAEDCEMLLATLVHRLAAFGRTAAEDRADAMAPLRTAPLRRGGGGGGNGHSTVRPRRVFVARYRDGQRRVLEDGVAALREMLAGASGSSSGDSD